MKLYYPYAESKSPVVGEHKLVSPFVRLKIKTNARIIPVEGLVDSGAAICLFDAEIGRHLGIDISSVPPVTVKGAAGHVSCYGHNLTIELSTSGGLSADVFNLIGYFAERVPYPCILGRIGFFERYSINFGPCKPGHGFDILKSLR